MLNEEATIRMTIPLTATTRMSPNQTRQTNRLNSLVKSVLLPFALLSLLPGCSMLMSDQSAQGNLTPDKATASAQVNSATTSPGATSEATKAPIPKDTLFSLMVAEFAGHRHQYDIAMDQYLQQAARTGDAGVAERALRIAQYTGHPEGVAEASTVWLAADPENPAAVQAAAQVALAQKDYEASLNYYLRFYQLTGIAQFDFFAASLASIQSPDSQAALNSLEKVAQDYPQEPNLLYARAILEQSLGSNDEAIRHIDAALKIKPDYLTASIQKGRILSADGQLEQAIRWMGRLHRKHPENKQVGLLYSRLLLQDNELKDARSVFADLNEIYPEDNQILLSLALLEDELGEHKRARAHFTALIERNQSLNESHYYLGRIAEDEEEDLLALDHYQQVMNSREYLPAQLAAARVLTRLEGVNEAISYLQTQAGLYPEHASQLTRIETDLLITADRMEDALMRLTGALNDTPDDENLRYTRAMVAEKVGDKTLMEDDLRHIIELNPDNAEALNALGYSLILMDGRLNEAEPLITRAIALQPENAAIIDSLGWLYFRQGRINEAGPLLMDAWNRMNDHEVAAHLGEWLWTTGNATEARVIWKRGLELVPDSPVIMETLERLGVEPDQL